MLPAIILFAAYVLMLTFSKDKGAIHKSDRMTRVEDIVPTILLAGTIVLLIAASFLPFEMPAETNGLICITLLIIGLIYNYAKSRNLKAVTGPLKAIDFETLGLLVGLFLMIGGIGNMGGIDALAALLAKLGAGNPFLMYTIIVWASVLNATFDFQLFRAFPLHRWKKPADTNHVFQRKTWEEFANESNRNRAPHRRPRAGGDPQGDPAHHAYP